MGTQKHRDRFEACPCVFITQSVTNVLQEQDHNSRVSRTSQCFFCIHYLQGLIGFTSRSFSVTWRGKGMIVLRTYGTLMRWGVSFQPLKRLVTSVGHLTAPLSRSSQCLTATLKDGAIGLNGRNGRIGRIGRIGFNGRNGLSDAALLFAHRADSLDLIYSAVLAGFATRGIRSDEESVATGLSQRVP